MRLAADISERRLRYSESNLALKRKRSESSDADGPAKRLGRHVEALELAKEKLIIEREQVCVCECVCVCLGARMLAPIRRLTVCLHSYDSILSKEP